MGKRNRERLERIRASLEAPRVLSAEERREERETLKWAEKQLLWGMRKPLK